MQVFILKGFVKLIILSFLCYDICESETYLGKLLVLLLLKHIKLK